MSQFESLAVPVVDVIRPVRTNLQPGRRGTDRIIADLRATLRMRRNTGAKLLCQHLRAEADAEEWTLLGERDGDPVDLAANEFIAVVRAHRAAENHGARMALQGFGKLIAKARPPYTERISKLSQRIADPTRSRRFLMQDDQHRQERPGSQGALGGWLGAGANGPHRPGGDING